jgi:hypothetical protein
MTERVELEENMDDASERPRSRRSFIFFGALAAATAVARPAGAQGRVAKPRTATPPTVIDDDTALASVIPNEAAAAPAEWAGSTSRLVRRLTYGARSTDLALANSLGYQGYLNYQLNYTHIDDSTVEAFTATQWPDLARSGPELFAAQSNNQITALQQAALYRAAYSKRQLYQRMVEFWTDHFNVEINKVSYYKLIDDRDVIRKHALGKFPDMLKASAHSAAMMLYLDQNLSRSGNPNQNYARELLELHTVGVDNGYDQDDVAELSRVLTGWTVLSQGRGFTFTSSLHDFGAKTVMGMTIPATSSSLGAGAVNEGEQILEMLATHPNTATYIATKMLKWLLTPDPTAAQISTIASVYRATKGDIKLMVRAILNEQWMMSAPVKFKRPFHLVASAMRGMVPSPTAFSTANTQVTNLGQAPFFWETPDGYPDTVEYWAGNILPRWAFANSLALGLSGLAYDTAPYLAVSRDGAVDMINDQCFAGEMPAATRTAIIGFLNGSTTYNNSRVRDAVGLALSSAAFQWY